MKERPILFSAPMVRALLAGTKTQTRRIVKLAEFGPTTASGDGWDWDFRDRRARWNSYTTKQLVESKHNPYGAPGDRLWVREAFTHITGNGIRVHYRADGEPTDRDGRVLPTEPGLPRWRPSIFMRRSESRITLEVTGVRVERLQSINAIDAIREGVVHDARDTWDGNVTYPLVRFRSLWEQINGPKSWDANPWVWVVEFKRIDVEAR